MRCGHRPTLAETRRKQCALRGVLGELERALVRRPSLVGATERAQELRPRRVIEVVPVEILGEREELEVCLLGAGNMPERDRSVQPHDRRVVDRELADEPYDLVDFQRSLLP